MCCAGGLAAKGPHARIITAFCHHVLPAHVKTQSHICLLPKDWGPIVQVEPASMTNGAAQQADGPQPPPAPAVQGQSASLAVGSTALPSATALQPPDVSMAAGAPGQQQPATLAGFHAGRSVAVGALAAQQTAGTFMLNALSQQSSSPGIVQSQQQAAAPLPGQAQAAGAQCLVLPLGWQQAQLSAPDNMSGKSGLQQRPASAAAGPAALTQLHMPMAWQLQGGRPASGNFQLAAAPAGPAGPAGPPADSLDPDYCPDG